MKCKKCGEIYEENLISCPKCNTYIGYMTEAERKKENRQLVITIVLSLVLFYILGVYGMPLAKKYVGFNYFQSLRANFITISSFVIPAFVFFYLPSLLSKKKISFKLPLFYILLYSIALISALNFHYNINVFFEKNPYYELNNYGTYELTSEYKEERANEKKEAREEFIRISGCSDLKGESFYECLDFAQREAANEGRSTNRFD